MEISIIIFEDNDRLRESLAYLLQSVPYYKVLGDYDNCRDAVNITRVYVPDVVLMDIDMPGESGIKGVSMVKETNPQTAVIMYTVFEDDEKLFQCLCAGANGYLLKKTAPEKIFEAIREVVEGGAPMSPSIAKKVMFARANLLLFSPIKTSAPNIKYLFISIRILVLCFLLFPYHDDQPRCSHHNLHTVLGLAMSFHPL